MHSHWPCCCDPGCWYLCVLCACNSGSPNEVYVPCGLLQNPNMGVTAIRPDGTETCYVVVDVVDQLLGQEVTTFARRNNCNDCCVPTGCNNCSPCPFAYDVSIAFLIGYDAPTDETWRLDVVANMSGRGSFCLWGGSQGGRYTITSSRVTKNGEEVQYSWTGVPYGVCSLSCRESPSTFSHVLRGSGDGPTLYVGHSYSRSGSECPPETSGAFSLDFFGILGPGGRAFTILNAGAFRLTAA